jgi:hypothetical protein
MNVSTKHGPSGNEATAVDADRSATATWVRPEIRRLAAGSAEDGFNASPDGFDPS